MLGFNVRADASARRVIENENIDLRYYSIIYELLHVIKAAMSGMLQPEFKQQIIGLAEVRDVFRHPKFGAIAGCMVTEGVVKRSNQFEYYVIMWLSSKVNLNLFVALKMTFQG